ncbi:MAG: rhomboid family intramembrane serine protease [Bifidobacteriaceae bacterium]|nr:rhomboid family intramembrane serine protease [Bifidobacteriaceae bacterium]
MTFSEAPVTMGLIAINVLIFILESAAGGSLNLDVAHRFGAMTVRDLERGQWWRLVTSMFVHYGIVHLACNMMSLYYLGAVIEQGFGSRLMSGSVFLAIVYVIAGIAGNLLTWRQQKSKYEYSTQSAGASGAICGLLGVYVAMLLTPGLRAYVNAGAVMMNVILCIAPGMANKSINMWAHLGGLIAGAVVGVAYFALLMFA